jgi:cytochrome oxidase Cu insertion factor (SCO1/SenC/PrrC family)
MKYDSKASPCSKFKVQGSGFKVPPCGALTPHASRVTRRVLTVLTVLTVFPLFAVAPRTGDFDYAAPAPGTYTLPAIKPAADGDVLDSTGRPLHLRELTRGRVTVMSFIYTRCAAARACPYATGVLKQIYEVSSKDPALANGMRLISISFDPAVDTPERMAAWATLADHGASAAPWRFLTTRSNTELQPILDAYGQAVDKKRNPLDPTGPLNHTLRVFLIDPDGNIRNIYSSDTLDPRLVLADIRTLLLEFPQR